MSLIAALCCPALAGGSVVRLDEGAAFLPPALPAEEGWELLSRAQVFPNTAWDEQDDRAITRLEETVQEVQPLIHMLDGEQEILKRLGPAIQDVTALRGPADQALLYGALAWEGFAAHRYFQDALTTDPEAAPYRVNVGGVRNRPWVDAVALAPGVVPGPEHIHEAPELAAFEAQRAEMLALPAGELLAGGLPPGAALIVDGSPSPDTSPELTPGHHRIAVSLGGSLIHRELIWVQPGDSARLSPVVEPGVLADLQARMQREEGLILLSEPVREILLPLEQPVYLLVGDPGEERLYRVEGAGVTRVEQERAEEDLWCLSGGLGAGLLHDPDWYLENAAEGAPDQASTTTAALPALSLSAQRWGAPLALGVGVDAAAGLGRWQKLPVGEAEARGRFYSYVSAGIRPVSATAGWLFPSHLGLGLRPQLPLGGGFALVFQGVYGLGLTRIRVGLPDGPASDVYGGWLLLTWGG